MDACPPIRGYAQANDLRPVALPRPGRLRRRARAASAAQPTAVAAQSLDASRFLMQVDGLLEGGKVDEAADLLQVLGSSMQVTQTSDLEDLAGMCHRERQVARLLSARSAAAGFAAAAARANGPARPSTLKK